jgi:hypothetical protein
MKNMQKELRKGIKKRTNKFTVETVKDHKQAKIDQFGIVRYAKKKRVETKRPNKVTNIYIYCIILNLHFCRVDLLILPQQLAFNRKRLAL